MSNNINCIILCAGKGSRMNSPTKHKVCFEIDGVPAINRIIGDFKSCGIKKFLVIVGSMAGQVMECVGNTYDDIAFVYQKTPLGTGDAAKKGIGLLKNMKIDGPVLITMGDKIVDANVIKEIIDKFYSQDLDLCMAIQPKEFNKSGGRIVFDEDGNLRGICESIDVQSAILYKNIYKLCTQAQKDQIALDIDPIMELGEKIITDNKKRELVLSEVNSIAKGEKFYDPANFLDKLQQNKQYIELGKDKFDPESVENTEYVNAALYLFKPKALNYAIDLICDNNIQKEIYLTDVVNILSNTYEKDSFKFRVSTVVAKHRNSIMSFNNAEELLEIENYFRSTKVSKTTELDISSSMLKPVNQWLNLFENSSSQVMEKMRDIYGHDSELVEERRKAYIDTLLAFREKYGSDREVVISRAPGRVNLMGRHVEHRGGHINVISINKEVICVASPRLDDTINITNVDGEFPDRSFNISQHLVTLNWKDWLSYLESDEIKKMVTDSQGDWMNYVKAPILRLQYLYKDRKLNGMDMAFNGNVPMAAGLSSSSAIVVATAEASVLLNKLDVTPQKFVDLCGEGEWFVGSRGGAGDHAAMKYGNRGYIAHIGFFPFSFLGTFKFPEKYKLIVVNSLVKAKKTANAKDTFNQRVASYEFGFMMLKEKFPQYSSMMEYLRDVNPRNLQVKPSKIYEMLLELPETVRPQELFDILPSKYHDRIRQIMSSHKAPEHYIIRSVILYGLAECERSRICRELLDTGNLKDFGKFMNISHDGDRVCIYNDEFHMQPYDWSVSDDYLKRLIKDLKSEDPQKVMDAQLSMQPGGYGCSTPEIDLIVDISKRIPGVIGAQLSGAGLGGCVMVLVKENAVDLLISELEKRYYEPKGLNTAITVCIPVKGSSVIEV